jgi:hypothetical protein
LRVSRATHPSPNLISPNGVLTYESHHTLHFAAIWARPNGKGQKNGGRKMGRLITSIGFFCLHFSALTPSPRDRADNTDDCHFSHDVVLGPAERKN